MKEFLIFIVAIFCGISCRNIDLSESRFLSEAIACETDSLCFFRVDSFLLENSESVLPHKLAWNTLPRVDTIINFHEYTDRRDYATILVMDNYEADKEGEYLIRLGSDDGFRIFVNKEEVASRFVGRALQLDSDWIPVHLKKGNNQIIFQVIQRTGDWKLHYRIDKGENLEVLIDDQLMEIYRDLPDLNILKDTAEFLMLNKDPRQNLDIWHSVAYSWVNPENGKTVAVERYKASEAPQAIPVPENAVFPFLFKYAVYNHHETKKVFSETIPIFSEASVEKYVMELHDKFGSGVENSEWLRGLELVFPDYLGMEQVRSYSTRIKTEFLWDALIQAGYQFQKIGGPRMTEVKNLISRVYRPDGYTNNHIKVFGVNPQPLDSVTHYLNSYHGYTHNSLRVRSGYARYFNAELTFPFIRQDTESNNLAAVLHFYTDALKDSSFSIMAWSNSVPLLLDVLASHPFPIKNVALFGSSLYDQPTNRFLTINQIEKYNPEIKWFIWHGEEDKKVPVSIIENWVTAFREQGFRVHYERLPLTNHEVYFTDPRKKFYQYITSD